MNDPFGDDRPQELPRACANCATRLVALQLQASPSEILCDYCAWAVNQDETRKAQSGASPPAEAFERSRFWDQHPLGPTKLEI